MKTKKVSYTGEVLEVSQPVKTLELEPGLPPPGLGGSLRCMDYCEGSVQEALLQLHLLELPTSELPLEVSRPRVQGSYAEW